MCVDLLGCWSLRGEFQVDSWQFKMMRITHDQCSYLLFYLCQATMSRLHRPPALHLDVLAYILLMHKVVIQPHNSLVNPSQGEISYTDGYAELRCTLLWFVSLPRPPEIQAQVDKLLEFKKITSRMVLVGCGKATDCGTPKFVVTAIYDDVAHILRYVHTVRRMILHFTYGSLPRPPDSHVSVYSSSTPLPFS